MSNSTRRTTLLRCEVLEARDVPAFLAPVTSPGEFDRVADVTADGKPDLIDLDYAAYEVRVRLGTGTGTFGAAVTSPTGSPRDGGSPTLHGVADVTADGKPDLVVTFGTGSAFVMRGMGNGTFQTSRELVTLPRVTVPGQRQPQAQGLAAQVVVGDLNGDGRVDLAVRGSYSTSTRGITTASRAYLNVFHGTPQGGYTAASPLFLMSGTGGGRGGVISASPTLHVADLTGDGRPDVLAADQRHGAVVLAGQPNGQFQETARTTQFVGGPVAVADLNADGKADVVGWRYEVNTVKVFLGNGDGTFGAALTFATGAGLGTVTVADVNRDGRPDLVTANVYAAGGGDSVSVLLGGGDGTFQPAQTTAVGAELLGVAVADFDGDGWLDLARREWVDGVYRVSVLRNDGVW